MSFFDKNVKRIKELERAIVRGSGDQDVLQKRIEDLRSRDPDWYVDYRDLRGVRHEEKCPPEYQNEKGAARYHALCLERVKKGSYNPLDVRNAKLRDMTAFYMQRKKLIAEKSGKIRGFATARLQCKNIDLLIGELRLNKMDADPTILEDFFLDFPRKDWSPKTVWNFFTQLKAVINCWIRFKRLVMKNPCDIIELDPQIKIMDYVPTREDFEKVITASFIVGLPDWVRNLLVAVFESGLRVNEIMKWRIEDLDMEEPAFGENAQLIKCPSFMVEISKQRRLTKKRIPMSFKLWQTIKAQIGERTEGLVFGRTKPPYSLLKWLRCPICSARICDNQRPYRRPGDACPKCNKGVLENWSIALEAGVPYFRPFHEYRKSVKWMNKIEKGLPSNVTMAFQGHASASMDNYYLHLTAQDLIPAVSDSWKTWRPTGDQK